MCEDLVSTLMSEWDGLTGEVLRNSEYLGLDSESDSRLNVLGFCDCSALDILAVRLIATARFLGSGDAVVLLTVWGLAGTVLKDVGEGEGVLFEQFLLVLTSGDDLWGELLRGKDFVGGEAIPLKGSNPMGVDLTCRLPLELTVKRNQ